MAVHYPVGSGCSYTLVPINKIYVYEIIADYLDNKRIIVENEARAGKISPFYEEKMLEGDPRDLARKTLCDEKIARLEQVFSGINKGLLPPVTLKKVSSGCYLVTNGMHRFTLSLLYRLEYVPAVIK